MKICRFFFLSLQRRTKNESFKITNMKKVQHSLFKYIIMVSNELFRQCLSAIPQEQRAEFDLSSSIAERLDAILKKKGITQHELACRLGKRDSEVSKWLTGRHNFTTSTIARIEQAIGDKLIQISK